MIFDLSEGDATGVEVRVRQGASISGVVVIEGANDPKILTKLSQISLYAYVRPTSQRASHFPGGGNAKVNADGSFRIRGLRPGKANIGMNQSPATRGLTIARIEHNGARAPDAPGGIEIGVEEHVSGVRIVLLYGAHTIRGELKIIGGELQASLRFYVVARRLDQSRQGSPAAEVDARGRFAVENVPPGEYEVIVYPNYPGNVRMDPHTVRLISSLKQRVVVAGANPQPVVLVLDLSRKEENR